MTESKLFDIMENYVEEEARVNNVRITIRYEDNQMQVIYYIDGMIVNVTFIRYRDYECISNYIDKIKSEIFGVISTLNGIAYARELRK